MFSYNIKSKYEHGTSPLSMGDSPRANVVEGEGVLLCPSLRFSPRLGSDLGSEAPGSNAFATAESSSIAVVSSTLGTREEGSGFALSFCIVRNDWNNFFWNFVLIQKN